jgi:GntR family transcriptional regulator
MAPTRTIPDTHGAWSGSDGQAGELWPHTRIQPMPSSYRIGSRMTAIRRLTLSEGRNIPSTLLGGTVTDVPTPHERPRYRRVADELRRRIVTGAIPPGSVLPSESALMADFGVARGTVREAVGLLRNEGLVVTEMGRGTYARPVLPVRRLGSDRYRRELDQIRNGELGTSFTSDQRIEWSDYRLDKEFHEVPADRATAELFGVEPGTMLLERRFVFRSQGIPQQMSTSCLLLDLVAGTPVADPDNEPWPGGNTAQLHSLGIVITGVRERIRRPSRSTIRLHHDAVSGAVSSVSDTSSTCGLTPLRGPAGVEENFRIVVLVDLSEPVGVAGVPGVRVAVCLVGGLVGGWRPGAAGGDRRRASRCKVME